jgi:hypothetical protein
MSKTPRKSPATIIGEKEQGMAEKLKGGASVNDQIKLLGRVAARLNNDPRNPMDVITHLFDFDPEQHRIFLSAYTSSPKGGDDPLEV